MEAVFATDIPFRDWNNLPMHGKILRLKEKSLGIKYNIADDNSRKDVEVHFKQ